MMKRYYAYPAIILVLLLLSSCTTTSGPAGTTSGRRETTATAQGVRFSFAPGVPPDTVYVEEGINEEPLEVAVEITNTGDYPRNEIGSLNGKLYLTGYDPAIVKSGRWTQTNQFNLLQGASESLPEGGYIQREFVAPNIHYPFDSKNYPLTLMLTACYYYETYATGIVCIDPKPAEVDDGKICQMGAVSLDKQRAPVQVTDVKQTGSSKETILTITIRNTGRGQVLNEFMEERKGVVTEDRCLDLEYGDGYLVGLYATITGLGKGKCTPLGNSQDPVRLYDGEATIVCKFPVGSELTSAYTTQMSITLQYGYLETIAKEVTLVNTATN